MKYDRDLHRADPRKTRVSRLFELHRQDARQTGTGRCYGASETLRADVALRLRDKAIQSLRKPYSDDPR